MKGICFRVLPTLMCGFLLCGCWAPLLVGAAGGAGAVFWVKGSAEGVYERDMETCWKACNDAFDSLKISKVEMGHEKDSLKRDLTGRSVGDDKIALHLESQSESVTKISVRVNVFGDKTTSARIHEEIRAHLPR